MVERVRALSPVDAPVEAEPTLVARLRSAGCVFAEDEAHLLSSAAQTPAELEAMVERRVAGLPLEHILGWAEFRGLRIGVEEGVFVPRRRTEFLVEQAVEVAHRALAVSPRGPEGRQNPTAQRTVVVDLCCGSGAVGAALAAALHDVEVHAADVDPVAVRCARRNLTAAGEHVYEGDLDEPLPADLHGRVDLLVANAPYVPSDAIALMPPEARTHESRTALDGGADGLDVQRRIIAAAPRWLAPGARLLMETSERQAPHSMAAITRAGMSAQVAQSAELDATVVIGTRTQPGA